MALVGHLGADLPAPPRAGHRAERRRGDARPRPRSSSWSSSPPGSRSGLGAARRPPDPAGGRASSSPTASTCAARCAAAARSRRPRRSARCYIDRTPGDDPPTRHDRAPVRGRARARSSAARTCSSRSSSTSPRSIGIEPLVLSLVLAPLATELPEKANSFFWVRDGKDTLALGNITGAMVFQSTIPIAVGLAAHGVGPRPLRGRLGGPGTGRRRDRLLGAAPARPVRAGRSVVAWLALFAASSSTWRWRGARRRSSASAVEHDVVVRLRRDLREDPGDRPVGADDEGRPLHAPVASCRTCDFSHPGAERLGDRVVGVGEQGEVRASTCPANLRDVLDRGPARPR